MKNYLLLFSSVVISLSIALDSVCQLPDNDLRDTQLFKSTGISSHHDIGRNMDCITWVNGAHPDATVDYSMNVLCSAGIIPNNQNIINVYSDIQLIDIARYLGKTLIANLALSVLDNFPTLYPSLQTLSVYDQRYIKLMLYLEYANKLSSALGTDDISPFTRDYFYTNWYGSISKSDGIKAILEAMNVSPFMANYDPTSNFNSTYFCDIKVSNKNLGWLQQAKSIGLLDYLMSGCGFGSDTNMTNAQFYVILAKLLQISTVPIIAYTDFFIPNTFYINNINANAGIEKGVFHEYSDNGFSIPSGGLSLDFKHSYHSNLTEIPFLNKNELNENSSLRSKLQPLGGGWTHSYCIYLRLLNNSANQLERILIYWPDGSIQSYLVQQNKYENKGVTDKLTIDSYYSANVPSAVTIKRGRIVYTFENIDNLSYGVLIITKIADAYNNTLLFQYINGYASTAGFEPKVLSKLTESYSGRSLTFSYVPGTNYLKSVSDPTNRTLNFYVNIYKHDLDSSADAKNQVTKYTYKEEVGTFAYRTHLLLGIKKPNGNTISNTYFSRKVSQSSSGPYVIKVNAIPDYHAPWSTQISQVSQTQNNQTITSKYIFDALGNRINNSTNLDSTQTIYDSENRPIIERNLRLSFITKRTYDSYGYLSKIVVVDSLFNDSTKYEYTNNPYGEQVNIKDYNVPISQLYRETIVNRNPQGSPTTIVELQGTPSQIKHEYTYANTGVVASYTDPEQFRTTFEYNQYGNQNRIIREKKGEMLL